MGAKNDIDEMWKSATALHKQGKLLDAIKIYEHIILQKPDCAEAYNNFPHFVGDAGPGQSHEFGRGVARSSSSSDTGRRFLPFQIAAVTIGLVHEMSCRP